MLYKTTCPRPPNAQVSGRTLHGEHVSMVCQCVGTSEVGGRWGGVESMLWWALCAMFAFELGAALIWALWDEDVEPVLAPVASEPFFLTTLF